MVTFADPSTIIDPGLLNHINHRLNDREPIDTIRQSLVDAGWERGQIEQAIREVQAARKNTDREHKGHPGIFMLNPRLNESANDSSPLEGRLSVLQYIVGLAFVALFDAVTITPLVWGYHVLPETPERNTIFFTVALGVVLVNIFTLISLCVRRLHDLGYDNTWALFVFVPGINIIFLLLLCTSGTKGPNKYGIDPRPLSLLRTLFNR